MALASVLITGDPLREQNVYMGKRTDHNARELLGSYLRTGNGGSYLLYRILDAVSDPKGVATSSRAGTRRFAAQFGLDVGNFPFDDYPHLDGYAIWRPFRAGGEDKGEIWRVEKPLGYGSRPNPLPAFPGGFAINVGVVPTVAVLDDAGLGFRYSTARQAWPKWIANPGLGTPSWVVLKLAAPLGYGALLAKLQTRCKDRLVVVMSIDDIRREDAMVSSRVSWERSALDLDWAFEKHPMLAEIKNKCRHLIVSFKSEGALLIENRTGKTGARRLLIYDPGHMEGEWAQKYEGSIFGFTSCLTAGVVNQLLMDYPGGPVSDIDLRKGVVAGLSAMRTLLLAGHGKTTDPEPSEQYSEVGKEILAPKTGVYTTVDLPEGQSDGWTIIAADSPRSKAGPVPLYGLATGVALMGDRALKDVPHLQLGNFRTVDRNEIESLRNIQEVVKDYLLSGPQKRPLSLAVFGPPGSGKSFSIKETAIALSKCKESFIEFNLSQFSKSRELIAAFHQVRDAVLRGMTPFVFWDEFDSREFSWLQYLLGPMQDGVFLDGETPHPIGKCIFIFAGGTSYDMEHFGPTAPDEIAFQADEIAHDEPEEKRRAREAYEKFQLCKGPDFKSRLTTFLNVLGPNPRLRYCSSEKKWEPDPDDVCFPIRRALFVRSVLGYRGDDRMQIDRGVLAALLRVNRFKHGSRSLEQILIQWKQRSAKQIRRSFLPPREILSLHVDAAEFTEIIREHDLLDADQDRLAKAMHEWWREQGGKMQPAYNKAYDKLADWIKEDNRAGAARLPLVLELAGLYVTRQRGDAARSERAQHVIERHVDLLAEAEHDGWLERHERNGWTFNKRRDDKQKLHPALEPFRDLNSKYQESSRNSVRNYPRILKEIDCYLTLVPPRFRAEE